MKITAAAKVGFAAIILALVFVAIFRGMGVPIPWLSAPPPGSYVILASFSSVKGLDPGADVQLNGNLIGEVGRITNDGFGGVTVELIIKGQHQIHENAVCTISRDSIFGSYMVTLDEPRAGHLTAPPYRNEFVVMTDTGMVDEGGMLWMQGRMLGEIISIEKADARTDHVTIRLSEDNVPINEKLAFVPTLFGTDLPRGFTVYSQLVNESLIDGDREPGPEDLVVDASIALADITAQADLIMGRLVSLLDQVDELIDSEEIHNLLDTLMAEASMVADNVARLTGRMDSTLAQSSPYIINSLANVEAITEDAQELLAGFSRYNDPEMFDNIQTLVSNLTEASEILGNILTDLEKYTSDETLRQDITGTITQARSTLQEAQVTLEAAHGAINSAVDTMDTVGGIETGAEFTLRYAGDPDVWAGDFDFWVGSENSDMFFTAGVDDIGESERGNVQVGLRLENDLAARAGIHRGKIGAGLDWRTEAFRFVSDVYDPNDLTWDVYGGYAILPELDLMIGIEDLLEEDELNFALAYRF